MESLQSSFSFSNRLRKAWKRVQTSPNEFVGNQFVAYSSNLLPGSRRPVCPQVTALPPALTRKTRPSAAPPPVVPRQRQLCLLHGLPVSSFVLSLRRPLHPQASPSLLKILKLLNRVLRLQNQVIPSSRIHVVSSLVFLSLMFFNPQPTNPVQVPASSLPGRREVSPLFSLWSRSPRDP